MCIRDSSVYYSSEPIFEIRAALQLTLHGECTLADNSHSTTRFSVSLTAVRSLWKLSVVVTSLTPLHSIAYLFAHLMFCSSLSTYTCIPFDCHYPRRLCRSACMGRIFVSVCLSVCLFVCLSATYLKNEWSQRVQTWYREWSSDVLYATWFAR